MTGQYVRADSVAETVRWALKENPTYVDWRAVAQQLLAAYDERRGATPTSVNVHVHPLSASDHRRVRAAIDKAINTALEELYEGRRREARGDDDDPTRT